METPPTAKTKPAEKPPLTPAAKPDCAPCAEKSARTLSAPPRSMIPNRAPRRTVAPAFAPPSAEEKRARQFAVNARQLTTAALEAMNRAQAAIDDCMAIHDADAKGAAQVQREIPAVEALRNVGTAFDKLLEEFMPRL